MKNTYRTVYDRVADVLCITALIGTFLWLFICWDTFPEQIAMHYNAAGEIDRYAERGALLILPVIGCVIYGILALVGYIPNAWNIPIKVTEENEERVFRIMTHFVSTLKMAILLFVTFMTVCSAQALNLPTWVGFLLLGLIALTIVYYITKLHKAK